MISPRAKCSIGLAGDDGPSALVAIVDDFEEIAVAVAGKGGAKAPIIEE